MTGRLHRDESKPYAIDASLLHLALRKHGQLDVRGLRVEGELEFDRWRIKGAISIVDCSLHSFSARNARFDGVLDFGHTTFSGSLDLTGATVQGILDLRRTVVAGTLTLLASRIHGGIPAGHLQVHGPLLADELRVDASLNLHDAKLRSATFNNAQIEQSLSLADAEFCGDAEFRNIHVRLIDASGADFCGTSNFDGARVASDAAFTSATFHGDAEMISLRVEDELVLNEAIFMGRLKAPKLHVGDLWMTQTRVNDRFNLDDCTIRFLLRMDTTEIGGEFSANGGSIARIEAPNATFNGLVVLKNLAIGSAVDLTSATFKQQFLLQSTSIGVGLDGSSACFLNGVKFRGVSVLGGLLLPKAVARMQRIDLAGSRIGGDIVLSESEIAACDLSGAAVGGRLLAHGIICDVLQLHNVSIDLDLEATGDGLRRLEMIGTTIGGSLLLDCTADRVVLEASFLKVKRNADFATSRFSRIDIQGGSVDGPLELSNVPVLPKKLILRSGTFGAIYLTKAIALSAEDRARFDGMKIDLADCTYTHLRSVPELLQKHLVDPTDRQPYLMFEQSLRRRGRDTEADKVYTAGKKARWKALGSLERSVDLLVRWVTGYGFDVPRTATILVGIWFCGLLYFAQFPGAAHLVNIRSGVVQTSGTSPAWCAHVESPDVFHAAWLATVALLPAPLPASSWVVADDCVQYSPLLGWTLLPVYALLKMSGLFLLPVLLAMLSGLFRPAARP